VVAADRGFGVPQSIYPFEGKVLDVGGVGLHVLDEGQDRGDGPLLMLHGNPTWSIYWRKLVLGLRDRYRCVVPDHIGCGFSEKPDDSRYPYTLSRRVADIETVVEQLDLGSRITLIAHDWGGMIGMAWAARHPEKVRRIVLMNTGAFQNPRQTALPFALWLTRTPLGTVLVRGANAFARGAVATCTTRTRMAPEVADAFCAPYRDWNSRLATLRFVQDIPLRPGDPAWPLLQQTEARLPLFKDRPVLLCWGARDYVFDDTFLERFQREWPQAETHRFADCGHYIMEDAGDEVVGIVERFLARS
jgi:haloalkane dehalogenase